MSPANYVRSLVLVIGLGSAALAAGNAAEQEALATPQAPVLDTSLNLPVADAPADGLSVTTQQAPIEAAELSPNGFMPLAPEPDLVLLLGLGLLVLGRLAGGRLG